MPDAKSAIQRSVEAIQRDWNASPDYDHIERDRDKNGSKTYQVLMILGSPYRRLLAVNGQQISRDDARKEQEKLAHEVAQRCSESPSQRQQRIHKYQQDRERDHRMIDQLTRAFVFRFAGNQKLEGHRTWVFDATPAPGYQPPNDETKALTGMRGTLWIDQETYQWVKVEAEVIQPVSIEGFLATVEPGTRFELNKAPVGNGIWLVTHFSERSQAEILGFIGHSTFDDDTYFRYQKAQLVYAPACAANTSAEGGASR